MKNTHSTHINKRQFLASLAAAGTLPLTLAPAQAATDWPSKTVRIIVPFGPGGGTDIVARTIGQHLGERLGQAFVIDNKPGAATTIGAQAVAKAAPDGYTLLLSGASTYSVNPALRKLPYDPLTDLLPVAIVADAALVLLVNAASPWQTLADLISAAKAAPGNLRYATFGPGTAPHLSGELLAAATGIKIQDIPYKGSAQTLVALLAEEVHIDIDTVAAALPHIQAKKLRALAVVGSKRSGLLPDVATVTELGFADAAFEGWYGLAAPAKTPADIVTKLAFETQVVMQNADLQKQLRQQGLDATYRDTHAFRQQMQAEITRYRTLAQQANIVVE